MAGLCDTAYLDILLGNLISLSSVLTRFSVKFGINANSALSNTEHFISAIDYIIVCTDFGSEIKKN